MTRRAAIATLAALAAVAAIITADLTPPAQAQSEESAGRIVARLLDDGRVEFGWQPGGGMRILPTQRYFPTDATIGRWLRSSPVEVDGAEIGRINARLLGDGRIEFAFTPTDGERITPEARYFPADVQVGRWLRSAEIAIGPAPAEQTPLAQAQSGESSGRIVARRLEDDRVEFGWQPSGGAEVLPTPAQRYFPTPADARVWGWWRSSPVEVDGSTIGRIDAGVLRDGRIEFVFTTTDGERIEPRARYFPGTAVQVGRWLRSTEITIVRAAPSYIAVGAGLFDACAIRTRGELECWGTSNIDAPEGTFTAVAAGDAHTCAISESDSAIECWGRNDHGQTYAPDGRYTAVSAGPEHTCAIRTSGEIACWGSNERSVFNSETQEDERRYAGQSIPPSGSYTAIAAGDAHTCAIHTSNGELACWGDNTWEITDAPEGGFTAVSAGTLHTCAIRTNGELACWGNNWREETDAPEGRYTAVSAGDRYTCAISENGEIECWGNNHYGQSDAPDGSFTTVAAGHAHTCAIRESGELECWGWNEYLMTYVPTD